MSPEQFARLKELFLEAMPYQGAAREQFLQHQAGHDPELLAELKNLLGQHEKTAEDILNRPPMLTPATLSAIVGKADTHASGTETQPMPLHRSRHAEDRFVSGEIIANRYRIIELVSAGGMGEVYRADDLKLDLEVALKFLPEEVGKDARWLQRLHDELRLARQVTHPNVCRVFDLGEHLGQSFISMEYVDGDNLASLLKKVGRFPMDRAMLLARQITAGLASVHEQGMLHRDLKPANILVDHSGQAHLADFGLAALGERVSGRAAKAGTPAYMAPEQTRGKDVTIRSDLYALGLVLYELLSGKATFQSDTRDGFAKLHESHPPVPIGEVMPEPLDPIVDGIIMQCLEKDPARRPASAKVVLAALSGGDALQMAISAGQLPTPELVAAAGHHTGLSRRSVWASLILILVSLAALVWVKGAAQLVAPEQIPLSAEVLADRARQMLLAAGCNETNYDEAYRFYWSWRGAEYAQSLGPQAQRETQNNQPGLMRFWYRQATQPLSPRGLGGRVTPNDPALLQPGMATVVLTPTGRLQKYIAAPASQVLPVPTTAPDYKYLAALFDAADLDLVHSVPKSTDRRPPLYADQIQAWNSVLRSTGERVEVVSATVGGVPVWFTVLEPWQKTNQVWEEDEFPHTAKNNIWFRLLLFVSVVSVGVGLTWRNVMQRTVDLTNALKLAGFCFVLHLIVWAVEAHHTAEAIPQFLRVINGASLSLLIATLVLVYYLALEPFIRRNWPQAMISWNNLLNGNPSHPMVAGGVLVGISAGLVTALIYGLGQWLVKCLTGIPVTSQADSFAAAISSRLGLQLLPAALINSIYSGFVILLIMVIFRKLIPRRWVAQSVFVGLVVLLYSPWSLAEWPLWLYGLALGVTALVVMKRFGLTSVVIGGFVLSLLNVTPVVCDFSAWYSQYTWLVVAAILTPTLLVLPLALRGVRD